MNDPDDEHTSWSEDLRTEVVHEFLARLVGVAGASELEMPHIVVCHDPETDAVTYSGPFPDGVSALVFAEEETAIDVELNDGQGLRFSVAALYPAESSLPGRPAGA